MQVHLDHAGVRRDPDDIEARIVRRWVALDVHWRCELCGSGLDGCENGEIVLESAEIRHEHTEPTIARLNRERGAHDAVFGGGRYHSGSIGAGGAVGHPGRLGGPWE